jgi:xanthosine utilization system XapX-like protein
MIVSIFDSEDNMKALAYFVTFIFLSAIGVVGFAMLSISTSKPANPFVTVFGILGILVLFVVGCEFVASLIGGRQ